MEGAAALQTSAAAPVWDHEKIRTREASHENTDTRSAADGAARGCLIVVNDEEWTQTGGCTVYKLLPPKPAV